MQVKIEDGGRNIQLDYLNYRYEYVPELGIYAIQRYIRDSWHVLFVCTNEQEGRCFWEHFVSELAKEVESRKDD